MRSFYSGWSRREARWFWGEWSSRGGGGWKGNPQSNKSSFFQFLKEKFFARLNALSWKKAWFHPLIVYHSIRESMKGRTRAIRRKSRKSCKSRRHTLTHQRQWDWFSKGKSKQKREILDKTKELEFIGLGEASLSALAEVAVAALSSVAHVAVGEVESVLVPVSVASSLRSDRSWPYSQRKKVERKSLDSHLPYP